MSLGPFPTQSIQFSGLLSPWSFLHLFGNVACIITFHDSKGIEKDCPDGLDTGIPREPASYYGHSDQYVLYPYFSVWWLVQSFQATQNVSQPRGLKEFGFGTTGGREDLVSLW